MTTAIIILSGFDVIRLAAASQLATTTVRRAYAGRVIEVGTRRRLECAAVQLDLPAPPPARTRPSSATSRPGARGAARIGRTVTPD